MFENIDIERSLKNAQTSLLIMIILTIVNILGHMLNAGIYLPYSAIIPYAIAFFSSGISFQTILLILLFIGFYIGVGIIAREKPIWYIGALALYVVDSIVAIFFLFYYGFDMVRMLELIFHGWILITLLKGSVAAYKKMVS